MVGFETERNSIGYLVDRATHLGIAGYAGQLSRVIGRQFRDPAKEEEKDARETEGDDKQVVAKKKKTKEK